MTQDSKTERLTPVERSLRLVTDIRAGEGATALVLLLNIFLVLTAYYLIKPVREGWLAVTTFGNLSKLEIKAYSSLGQSLVLVGAVPLYAWLAGRWSRRQLVNRVVLFFIACLVVFWILQPDGTHPAAPYSGVLFYLFVGIFGLAAVAQFWSFAADVYSDERGKRIFPLIAMGGAVGGVFGAWLSGWLLRHGLDSSMLPLLGAAALLGSLALTGIADARGMTGRRRPGVQPAPEEPAAPDPGGPFELIFRTRYLMLVATFSMLVNWVNTNGENVLFGAVQEALAAKVSHSGLEEPTEVARFVREGTTQFYGNLYAWVNLASLLIQALVVSRVLKFGGLVALILLTPTISFFSYTLMMVFPILLVIKVMKIAENSANYSANNTARSVLWLPAPREAVYKAKTAIDTVFARTGDVLAAGTVFAGTQLLQWPLRTFLVVNIVLVGVWILVCVGLAREYRRLARLAESEGGARVSLETFLERMA